MGIGTGMIETAWGWRQDAGKLVTFVLMLFLLGFFVLYPLYTLLIRSLYDFQAHVWTARNYIEFFSNPEVFSAFLNTLWMAAGCVGMSLVFALPMAWGVSRTNMPMRGFVRTMVVLTFATPSFLGAIAWITLLGPRAGLLNEFLKRLFGLSKNPFDIFSFWGMTFVMGLFVYPFLFYSVSSALDNMDTSYEQAANILGASNVRVLLLVTLPLVTPAILSGLILVILECFIVFGAPAILGNPVLINTLSTQVYRFFAEDPPRFDMAATTAVPIIVVTAILLIIQRVYLGRRRYITVSGKAAQPQLINIGRWRYLLAGYSLAVVTVSVILPVAALIGTSFIKVLGGGYFNLSNYTFQNYIFLFTSSDVIPRAFYHSFILALGAAFLAVGFTFFMAWFVERSGFPGREGLSLLTMLALAFPGVAYGVSLVLAFSRWPLALYGTLGIFLVGYSVKGIPMAYIFARSSLQQISEELEQSARALGASWIRTMLEVTLPLMKKGLLSVGTIVFCIMFREMPLSMLVYIGGLEVVAVMIMEFLNEGNMAVVSAIATIVLLINITLIVLSKWIVGKGAFEQ